MMRRALSLLFAVAAGAAAAEVLEYAGAPLPVALPVGQERRILVEGAREVRVGLSGRLRESLQVESAGPHVWLRAHAPLEPARLYLEADEDLYVLEVRTADAAPRHALKLRARAQAAPEARPDAPGYIALARYAVQSLYAPQRREAQLPGIQRVPLPDGPQALFRCRPAPPSACGDAVQARPHTAWRAAPYYATALTVRNMLPEPLELDPRDLRGDFAAAVIVHARLAPHGSPHDSTAVVLISTVPFARALRHA